MDGSDRSRTSAMTMTLEFIVRVVVFNIKDAWFMGHKQLVMGHSFRWVAELWFIVTRRLIWSTKSSS